MRWIWRPLPRYEDPVLLRGRGPYTADLAARAEGRWLGLGISICAERTGPGTPVFAARRMVITPGFEPVELVMDPSGFVEARIGRSPRGQGLKTTLAPLFADELGVVPNEIRIVAGDTDRTPYGWGAFASRSLVLARGACKLAATALRESLQIVAGQLLEAALSDIEIANSRAFVRGTDPVLAGGVCRSRRDLPAGRLHFVGDPCAIAAARLLAPLRNAADGSLRQEAGYRERRLFVAATRTRCEVKVLN